MAAVAFGAGYVVHRQPADQTLARPSPHPTQSLPPIDPAKEARASRVFCGHLRRFNLVEQEIRQRRFVDASKTLGQLSNQLIADSDLYQAAHDYRAVNRIGGPASFLGSLETLPQLFQIEGTLQKICDDTSHPASSG